MKKILDTVFNIQLFRLPSSGNLSITTADVLVEDMILESGEASGGVVLPKILLLGQLAQNIQLTDRVLGTGASH